MIKKILIWILALILLCSFVSANDVNLSVVSHYTADNSMTIVNLSIDSNGKFNASIYYPATTGYTGKIGQAYYLESQKATASKGSKVQTSIPSTTTGKYGNNWTSCAWVNWSQNTANYDGVMGDMSVADGIGVGLDSDNTVRLYTGAWTDSNFAVGLNAWHYICLVSMWNGTTGNQSIFINGTLRLTRSGTYTNSTYNWTFGNIYANDGNLNEGINGTIDLMTIWNRTLNQDNLTYLYNNGNGIDFPFREITTSINITASDEWNTTSIPSFSTNISWSNGSTTTHSSTYGYVYITNMTNGGNTYNITFWNTSNYFTRTYYTQTLTNATTNTLDGKLHQAEVCFNASEKISGTYITPNNFTINSTTRTTCFNLSAGSYNIMAKKIGWFDKNQTFTVTALQNNTQTIANMSYANLTIYVRDANGSTFLSGYTLNLTSINYTSWPGEHYASTTNQSYNLINGTYHAIVDVPGYALTNAEANITVAGNTNYTFWLHATNTVNITFLYEANNTLVAGPTISADLIVDDTNATSGTTTTGYLWVEGLTPGDYEIRYSTTDFQERSYFFTLTNRTYSELTLYLIEDTPSEDILLNLFDEFTNPLPEYTIKLLRYYASEDGYVEVDMGKTNSEGQTQVRATRNGPYYKFRILDTDGDVIQTTTATQIYDTELNLYVTLGGSVGQLMNELNSVSYSLTYLNTTKQFKFSWDNSDNTVTNAQLKIYTTDLQTGDTLYNSSSTASSSGTIYLSIAEVNGTTYKALAYLTFSGDTTATLVGTLTHTFEGIVETFGKYGLLLTFFILIAVSMIGIWNPAALTILIPTALTVTRIAQFHALDKTWIVSIWAVGIIILYIIRDKA